MSNLQQAYNQMAKRDRNVETISKEEYEAQLQIEEELKTWLKLPKTKDLLIFLAKRELDLFNNARNCSKTDNDAAVYRNLSKSAAIREVIEFITENKQPIEKEQ